MRMEGKMYQILQAKELTTNIYMMVVEAARVAKSCEPGQFVIVRTDADSERIPLTICDDDREARTITIVFPEGGGFLPRCGGPSGQAFRTGGRDAGGAGCEEDPFRGGRRRHCSGISSGKMAA